MDKAKIDLSIIIPVYNCSSWIITNLEKIYNFFQKNYKHWELIAVDDGSSDNTVEIIESSKLVLKKNFQLIINEKNMGKGGAVFRGLKESSGEYRVFADCDLAYPLSEIKKVVDTLELGADIAIANRRISGSICELNPKLFRIVHSRELYGRILNSLIRFLGLAKVEDTQAGLKGFNQWVINRLDNIDSTRFGFDIELLYKSSILGAKIKSVPVRYQFFDNQSSVKIFRDGIKILNEMFKLWLNHIKR